MKDTWERTDAALPAVLTLAEIDALVRPAFTRRRVVSAKRIPTGLSNTNVRIRIDGMDEPFVLRLYRGPAEVATKEVHVARLVQETVPVAEFLYVDDRCVTYARPWAILRWVHGRLLWNLRRTGSDREVTSAAESAGRTLARIHAYPFDRSGFLGPDLAVRQPFEMDGDRFLNVIRQALEQGQCGRWLGPELSDGLWTFCQRHAPALSAVRERPVLVHSDFNGLNVLVQPDVGGRYSVAAVLDWEDAFSWNRYADLGNMLRYEDPDSRFAVHVIRGYREEGGQLEPRWHRLSKLEDLVALCDMLDHSTAETPNRRQDLVRLIADTIRHTPY